MDPTLWNPIAGPDWRLPVIGRPSTPIPPTTTFTSRPPPLMSLFDPPPAVSYPSTRNMSFQPLPLRSTAVAPSLPQIKPSSLLPLSSPSVVPVRAPPPTALQASSSLAPVLQLSPPVISHSAPIWPAESRAPQASALPQRLLPSFAPLPTPQLLLQPLLPESRVQEADTPRIREAMQFEVNPAFSSPPALTMPAAPTNLFSPIFTESPPTRSAPALEIASPQVTMPAPRFERKPMPRILLPHLPTLIAPTDSTSPQETIQDSDAVVSPQIDEPQPPFTGVVDAGIVGNTVDDPLTHIDALTCHDYDESIQTMMQMAQDAPNTLPLSMEPLTDTDEISISATDLLALAASHASPLEPEDQVDAASVLESGDPGTSMSSVENALRTVNALIDFTERELVDPSVSPSVLAMSTCHQAATPMPLSFPYQAMVSYDIEISPAPSLVHHLELPDDAYDAVESYLPAICDDSPSHRGLFDMLFEMNQAFQNHVFWQQLPFRPVFFPHWYAANAHQMLQVGLSHRIPGGNLEWNSTGTAYARLESVELLEDGDDALQQETPVEQASGVVEELPDALDLEDQEEVLEETGVACHEEGNPATFAVDKLPSDSDRPLEEQVCAWQEINDPPQPPLELNYNDESISESVTFDVNEDSSSEDEASSLLGSQSFINTSVHFPLSQDLTPPPSTDNIEQPRAPTVKEIFQQQMTEWSQVPEARPVPLAIHFICAFLTRPVYAPAPLKPILHVVAPEVANKHALASKKKRKATLHPNLLVGAPPLKLSKI